MSDAELGYVVAHEIGHAIDHALNDAQDRVSWRASRGMEKPAVVARSRRVRSRHTSRRLRRVLRNMGNRLDPTLSLGELQQRNRAC